VCLSCARTSVCACTCACLILFLSHVLPFIHTYLSLSSSPLLFLSRLIPSRQPQNSHRSANATPVPHPHSHQPLLKAIVPRGGLSLSHHTINRHQRPQFRQTCPSLILQTVGQGSLLTFVRWPQITPPGTDRTFTYLRTRPHCRSRVSSVAAVSHSISETCSGINQQDRRTSCSTVQALLRLINCELPLLPLVATAHRQPRTAAGPLQDCFSTALTGRNCARERHTTRTFNFLCPSSSSRPRFISAQKRTNQPLPSAASSAVPSF
jgi:hypothetical protein